MEFKIVKETRWKASKMASETVYYVWADDRECLDACATEEEALIVFEAAKKNYVKNAKEIVLKEEVNP